MPSMNSSTGVGAGGSRPPPGHPSALNGLPFEEYDATSFPGSPSHSPDSELWCDEDDLLQLPCYSEEEERLADPLFPSPHKFNLMMQDYLRNLSPKKREKALLTQKMYDAVLTVLQDPKDTNTKTAQFRFWAKKMFQLTQFGEEKVVCHDHKPVAVKEQIYEVLCHCHGQAGHGGRDKTSAQVRRYYSWIPKEIIARFVRDCPFCQSRRTQSTAGLSSMSESQAFLISLQTCDTQSTSASKRSVSLAQARANAAALGHKPYRRPSLRAMNMDMSGVGGDGGGGGMGFNRSRRGSAGSLTEEHYVHYSDGPMNTSMSMDNNVTENGGYQMSLAVPQQAGYSFDLSQDPSHQHQQQTQAYAYSSNPSTMAAPIPMPRRASSYHESSNLLAVRPSDAMLRRNSESDISFGISPNTCMYSEPDSLSTFGMGQNQSRYLSVPGMEMVNTNNNMNMGGMGLQRSASASSLPSLNDNTLTHFRQYAEQLRIDTTIAAASDVNNVNNVDPTATNTIQSVSMYDYRDPSSGSSTISALPSEAVTPIEGHFPLSYCGQGVGIGQMDMSYFTTYDMSVPVSTQMDNFFSQSQSSNYQFPGPSTSAQVQTQDIWNPSFTFTSVPTAATTASTKEETEEDEATAEAVAMVQRMFDSNNIFALGVAAETNQEIDPALLNDLQALNTGDNSIGSNEVSLNSEGDNSLGLTLADASEEYTSVNVQNSMGMGMGGAQIIVTHPSMTLFHSETNPNSTTIYPDNSNDNNQFVEYTFDEQFQDLHLAFAPNPLEPLVNDNLDMFGYIPVPTTNDILSSVQMGTNPMETEGTGMAMVQHDLDFSNWAGFVMS